MPDGIWIVPHIIGAIVTGASFPTKSARLNDTSDVPPLSAGGQARRGGYNIGSHGAQMVHKIRKVGNSLGVTFSSAELAKAGLVEGSEVEVIVTGQELRLVPAHPDQRNLTAEQVEIGSRFMARYSRAFTVLAGS